LFLFWITVTLLLPDAGKEGTAVKRNEHLIAAIKTTLIADLVLSLDNVIGVAAGPRAI
jgi:predicted tellurium resistance membrane protein TerC